MAVSTESTCVSVALSSEVAAFLQYTRLGRVAARLGAVTQVSVCGRSVLKNEQSRPVPSRTTDSIWCQ